MHNTLIPKITDRFSEYDAFEDTLIIVNGVISEGGQGIPQGERNRRHLRTRNAHGEVQSMNAQASSGAIDCDRRHDQGVEHLRDEPDHRRNRRNRSKRGCHRAIDDIVAVLVQSALVTTANGNLSVKVMLRLLLVLRTLRVLSISRQTSCPSTIASTVAMKYETKLFSSLLYGRTQDSDLYIEYC